MLATIGYVYFVSIVLAATIFTIDVHMYPICPQCHHNLYSKRIKFGAPMVRCSRHGFFVVMKLQDPTKQKRKESFWQFLREYFSL